MLDDADLALQGVEPLDVGAAEVRLEDLVLDRLEVGLERVDDREVAVDDGIQQRVEDEGRAVLEQVRLALGALAHAEKALVGAVAHREHEVRADEDVDLADDQLVGGPDLDRVQDREQRVAVLLDLRTLVAVARVLDRESCRPNSRCIFSSSSGVASLSATQTKQPRPLDVIADVVDRDVGEALAVSRRRRS